MHCSDYVTYEQPLDQPWPYVGVGLWFVRIFQTLSDAGWCRFWWNYHGLNANIGGLKRILVSNYVIAQKNIFEAKQKPPYLAPPIKFPDSFRRDDVPMKWERKKALVLLMAPSETWIKHLPSSLNCTFSNILQNIAKQRLSTFWCLASLYFCDCWSNMKGKGGKQFRALLTMKEHRRGMDTRLFSNSLPPTTSLLE